MPITEKQLRLIIIDDERFILLDGKQPPEELHGPRRHAALQLFNLDAPPTRVRAAEPVDWGASDSIRPAPERHWKMPKGITRNATTRSSYPEDAHPKLHAASHKVLRTVAELAKPAVLFREVLARIRERDSAGEKPMPHGTVSSQLFMLAEAGYLLKEQSGKSNLLIYTLTTAGEDVLTSPAHKDTP